jgi:uncharacterized protein YsxB (DUF464 family)
MITVTTQDVSDGLVIEIQGHANEGEDRVQVCASISALSASIYAFSDNESPSKEANLDGTGEMVFRVRDSRVEYLSIIVAAMAIVADNYEGHLSFGLRDTKLFQSEVSRGWKQLVLNLKKEPVL